MRCNLVSANLERIGYGIRIGNVRNRHRPDVQLGHEEVPVYHDGHFTRAGQFRRADDARARLLHRFARFFTVHAHDHSLGERRFRSGTLQIQRGGAAFQRIPEAALGVQFKFVLDSGRLRFFGQRAVQILQRQRARAEGVGGFYGYGAGVGMVIGGILTIIASGVGIVASYGAGVVPGVVGMAEGASMIAAGAGTIAGTSVGIANSEKQIKALEGDKKAQENLLKQMYLNSLGMMVNNINQGYAKQQAREAAKQR